MATSSSWLGKTSSPSARNSAICATQARPWWNTVTVRLAGIRAEPSTSPATYTARKPEPCKASAAPKAIAAVASEATGYSPVESSRVRCRPWTASQPTAMPTSAPAPSSSTSRMAMSATP